VRILVTGASGFVGGHLIKRLLDDEHEIHVLARPSTDLDIFGRDLDRIASHVFRGTTENMIALVETARPDAVVHLASLFLGEHKAENVDDLIASNVLLCTQLTEAMVANDVESLINVGTSWQHYEDGDYNPVNLYAATKQAFRSILRYYVEVSNLKVINLELFDTFGPDDERGKIFSLLERLTTTGDSLSMSLGDQQINPVYIDDVSEAFVVALHRLQTGAVQNEETYSVCSDNPVNLRGLVEAYETVTGIPLNIEWGGRPYRNREVMLPWARGEMLPGWKAEVSLQDGIKRIVGPNV
jgi:nucleoside-diphosphate-sugar epimerase